MLYTGFSYSCQMGPQSMTLLYFALAYFLGIASAQFLWQWGLFGCGVGHGMWLMTLALIPVCLWLDARTASSASLRWPAAAGFIAPRTITPWLLKGLLLAGLTGILRLASHPPTPCWTPTDLAYYNASDRARASLITVRGFVTGFPLHQEGQQRLDIEATAIRIHHNAIWQPLTGRVRLQTRSLHPFRYGEPVQVSGLLTEPPIFEGFDYRFFLARKHIHSIMEWPTVEPQPAPLQGSPLLRAIYALRTRSTYLLNRLLPEPYAALANGMLLGIEAGIPDELYEQFNRTGTSHVIVISGSNVALIAGALMVLGVKLLGMRFALWPTLVGIGLYVLLVGGDAAVLRAALMGALLVLATVLGRQQTALVSLAVACTVMTLINPLILWDVGFQLSSTATVGLILFGPSLTDQAERLWSRIVRIFRPNRQPSEHPQSAFLIPHSIRDLLRDALIMTIAASLITQPLILYYFGRLSLNPLTNLLIAPVQPFIMLWGSIGLLIGWIGLPVFAQLIFYIPYVSLWWTVAIVRWGAQLPGSSVAIFGYDIRKLLLTYAVLFGWYWRIPLRRIIARVPLWIREATAQGQISNSILGALVVIASLLWGLALSQPDGKLHVYFLDIGQGDGIFIQMPSGQQVLIDGGSNPARLMAELSEVMPFWDRTIDLAIITHPDWDHIGGQIELPERYALKQAIISETVHAHMDTRPWLDALGTAGVRAEGLRQGGWLDLGDGVALWALWPSPYMQGIYAADKNEQSLVLKLVYGEFSVLLTGDIGRDSEAQLLHMGQPIGAQVLKVGHHGSASSSIPSFLEAVGAKVAVIQVGMNSYGHPHPQVLESLQEHLLLRNDQHGRIHMWSDGQSMWLETEQGEVTFVGGKEDEG